MASDYPPFLPHIWGPPTSSEPPPPNGYPNKARSLADVSPGSGFASVAAPALGGGQMLAVGPQMPLKIYVVALARPYVLPFYKACAWVDFNRIINGILSDLHSDPTSVNEDTPAPNSWIVVDRDGSIVSGDFWEDLVTPGAEYGILPRRPAAATQSAVPDPVPASMGGVDVMRPSTSTSEKSSVETDQATGTPRASISSGSSYLSDSGSRAGEVGSKNIAIGGADGDGNVGAGTTIPWDRKMKYSEVAASHSPHWTTPDQVQTLRQLLNNASTARTSTSTPAPPPTSANATPPTNPVPATEGPWSTVPRTYSPSAKVSIITMKVFERDTFPSKSRAIKLSSKTSVGDFITRIGGGPGSRLQELRIVQRPGGQGQEMWKGQTFMSGTVKSLEDVGWGEKARKWGFVGVILRKGTS